MSLGSWMRNHPAFLEKLYLTTRQLVKWLHPWIRRLGYERADAWLHPFEFASKKIMFDCQMCGQCILHSTGMTCPMSCPKNLRNGPCGGVRGNGHCEVKPEMMCIWVEAYGRSLKMPQFGHEFTLLQPPLNRQLLGSSAWINDLCDLQPLTPDTLPIFVRAADSHSAQEGAHG